MTREIHITPEQRQMARLLGFDIDSLMALIERMMHETEPDPSVERMNEADARANEVGNGLPYHALPVALARASADIEQQIKDGIKDGSVPSDVPYGRDCLEPGEYGVSFRVQVSGTIKVGEDYEQRIVAKADPWKLLGLALSKLNGVSVEALVREAFEIEARGEEQETKKHCTRTLGVRTRAANAIKDLKSATFTRCRGKVTSDLRVGVVS